MSTNTVVPEHRSYPVLSLPVHDLRVGDVFVYSDGKIISLDGETPWARRITELRPEGLTTIFALNCADEMSVYRKPTEEEVAAEIERKTAPSSNTQRLAGIRCPECSSESAFVVQITINAVMLDEGFDIFGCEEPPADHFPGRVIDSEDGFFDDDPIQCYQRRGGCGHRGTVKEFRTSEAASVAA